MHNIDSYYNLKDTRTDAKILASKLCDYDVISFDVFDTLILRPFTSPRVLFSIMEQRLGIYKFANIRVDSENEIRSLKQKSENHDNVTLKEIYDLISKKTSLDPEQTANLEYKLELNYCFANPYFQEIMPVLKENNKKIIITSDMYLSKQQIRSILELAGYNFFDNIFVSSEYKKSKKHGDIYETIKEKYPNKKIIHIGDNYKSDIENAKTTGIDTYYYKNVNEVASKTRIPDMSYITSRVYSATVNNHLYNGPEKHSNEYKLGYIYGGIYILGFVQWINRFTENHDIDKVLFLARDGDIYSRIYDKLSGRKEWEYFYWSRLAGMRVIALENFYEFCRRMIWHKSRGVYNIKVSHLLDFYQVSYLNEKLGEHNLTKDDVLSKDTAQAIENLFYANKSDILKTFESDINATFKQVRKSIGNARKVAIVDVGWAGTGPITIKKIANHYLDLDTKTYALLAGFRQPFENMASIYTMDDTVHAYFFSNGSNKDILDSHLNHGTNKNNLLLEIFTQSCSPSFLGYKCDDLEFDYEETENYQIIEEINQGIEDFIDIYLNTFKEDEFILNISPYDAYLPFDELKSSVERIDSILKKMVISRGKFYDAENKSNETWLSFFSKDD